MDKRKRKKKRKKERKEGHGTATEKGGGGGEGRRGGGGRRGACAVSNLGEQIGSSVEVLSNPFTGKGGSVPFVRCQGNAGPCSINNLICPQVKK